MDLENKINGITYENLSVKSKLPVKTLQDFVCTTRLNQHVKAEITGILDISEDETYNDILNGVFIGETITIREISDDKSEKNLFCGLIKNIEIDWKGKLPYFVIQAVSATYLMDLSEKKRSFQDTSLTYRDIIQLVLKGYDHSEMIWMGEDQTIDKPVIQYNETDWEFINRILGRQQLSAIVESTTDRIRFYAGIREGDSRNIEVKAPFFMIRSSNFDDGVSRFYNEIESLEPYEIGDQLNAQGQRYRICEKKMKLREGMLFFTYRMAGENYFLRKECFNPKVKGVSITGTILQTIGESVKLHLDVDAAQDKGTAFLYPWKPLTGNHVYCMPEVGTKAVLYISEQDEREAAVIYNVRENGENCSECGNPDHRYFTTAKKKRMYNTPDKVGIRAFDTPKGEMTVFMDDNFGINLESDYKITFVAEKAVEFYGRQIDIKACQESTLVRKGLSAPAVINMCNDLDAIGKIGGFKKSLSQTQLTKRSADISSSNSEAKEEQFDLGSVAGYMFYQIPVDIKEDEITRKVLGSVPLI